MSEASSMGSFSLHHSSSMDRPNSVPPRHMSLQGNKDEASKHMADLKKENFSLKLKIYYLETTLSKVSGVEQFDVLQENVSLKVEKENLLKELTTNKALLVKASSVVDSLSGKRYGSQDSISKQIQEKDELQKMVSALEKELTRAREEIETQAMELEQVHTDCLLLEDQLRQRDEAKLPVNEEVEEAEDVLTLQAKLDAQDHLHQSDIEALQEELGEVREAMLKLQDENVNNRLVMAEKEHKVKELQRLLDNKSDCSEADSTESRATLLELLSQYTANNARQEEELNSMEGTNTELNNLINNLNNEREKLLSELSQRDDVQNELKRCEKELEEARHKKNEGLTELLADNESLSNEIVSLKEESLELQHSLSQVKLNNDVASHEAAVLRGSIEDAEFQKEKNATTCRTLKHNVERLSKDNADCFRDNSILQQENEMLREKIQELNNDISELKEDKRLLKLEASSQKDCKINEMSEEILSLKQSLSDNNEELKFCREDLKSAESDYEKTAEELELLEEELKESEEKRINATDQLDELKEEFIKFKTQSNEDRHSIKQEGTKAGRELAKASREYADAEREKDLAVREKDLAIEEKIQAVITNEGLVREKERTEEEMREAVRANEGLVKDMEGLGMDMKALKKKNEGLIDEVKALLKEKGKLQFENKKLQTDQKKMNEERRGGDREEELSAHKSYLENRIKELCDTKQSLEDSVLSLKDQLELTPIPHCYDFDSGLDSDESKLKDSIITELKSERDHHRSQRKDLEQQFRTIHEVIHGLIRELHRYNDKSSSPLNLITNTQGDYLIDSLKAAIEVVVNTLYTRERQSSATSSGQTTSGVASLSEDTPRVHRSQEDVQSLKKENDLLHNDLMESRDLIAALRKEMKDLLYKLNNTEMGGESHLRTILCQINSLMSSSPTNHNTSKLETLTKELSDSSKILITTQNRLRSSEAKLNNAEHKIASLENKLNHKEQMHFNSDTSLTAAEEKVKTLELQLENTEELLREKMRLVREKNNVIDSLLDEKRELSFTENNNTSPTSISSFSPTSQQISNYITLCSNNLSNCSNIWLEELPELMRALRDAVHTSLVDCQSVQTRVKEKKAMWAMSEVSRLSTRLDAVYKLLQHVENLSCQQPPARLLHSLQQSVFDKDRDIDVLHNKLQKRSKDITKLRAKIDERDKCKLKQRSQYSDNSSILNKVMDTEAVLKEAHRSLEKRMMAKEKENIG